MFKVTVTTTATSLWVLALNDTNRDALLKQINSKRGSWNDNLYVQNWWALNIFISEIIIPTTATWIKLAAWNENTYHITDLKQVYLISSWSNADVVISWL